VEQKVDDTWQIVDATGNFTQLESNDIQIITAVQWYDTYSLFTRARHSRQKAMVYLKWCAKRLTNPIHMFSRC